MNEMKTTKQKQKNKKVEKLYINFASLLLLRQGKWPLDYFTRGE